MNTLNCLTDLFWIQTNLFTCKVCLKFLRSVCERSRSFCIVSTVANSSPCFWFKKKKGTRFYKKNFYKKMNLKNRKTLIKCYENLQPKKPEMQFFKKLIFPRAQFGFFSYLKLFSVFVINGSTILFSKHRKIKRRKHWVM